MDNLIKFRVENFASYGLNKYRNFLGAPECGSEGTRLMLKNQNDMFDFMVAMLVEHGCLSGALFAVSYDDHMYAAVMNENAFVPTQEEMLEYVEESGQVITEEELEEFPDEEDLPDPVILLGIDEIDMDFFGEIDAEFRCCCYGLMIETAPGKWKIIKE